MQSRPKGEPGLAVCSHLGRTSRSARAGYQTLAHRGGPRPTANECDFTVAAPANSVDDPKIGQIWPRGQSVSTAPSCRWAGTTKPGQDGSELMYGGCGGQGS
jgi:hypothetical protein